VQADGAIARRFQYAIESSVNVRVAACSALEATGVWHVLPLPYDAAEATAAATATETSGTGDDSVIPAPSRCIVVAGLAGILKSDKSEAKLVEAASTALGRL
jgi:hypothetical protein